MLQKNRVRDVSFDNIRFFLMFFVVLVHFMEVSGPFPGKEVFADVLISCLMPSFIFVLGYFARYAPAKLLRGWVLPYGIFQSVYIYFARFVLGERLALQYVVPYWLLWFMVAGAFYHLLLPVYDLAKGKKQILAVLSMVVLAVLAGRDDNVGYYLSVSRFLVFQPWFVLGYYCRKQQVLDKADLWGKKNRILLWAGSIIGLLLSVVFFHTQRPSVFLLHGSLSYETMECAMWLRPAIMVISFIWIVFVFLALRPLLRKKLFLITYIGRNTLSIYLLHGFIVKLFGKFLPSSMRTPLAALLFTCGTVLLLGQPFLTKLLSGGFSFKKQKIESTNQ